MSKIDLSGRIVLVTGAGGGLGRSHALAFARYGATVIVNDIAPLGRADIPSERPTTDEITTAGGKACWLQGDVGDFRQAQNMIDIVVADHGRLDILVNNAGIFRPALFSETDMTDFEAELKVHLMGSANMTRAAWPIMQKQGYGRVVMTTSSSALGSPGQAGYSAAKMGVLGLMNTLALEGEPFGIHVNAIMPCARSKELEAGFSTEFVDAMDPALPSEGVVFLASEAAPTRCVLFAAGGGFSTVHVLDSDGVFLGKSANANSVHQHFAEIDSLLAPKKFQNVYDHISRFNNAIGISGNILKAETET